MSARPNATPLLEAASLSRRFGGLAAVDEVSVALHLGEVHAVIGTNGAGKSTLINMLSGEMPPSDGEIRLRGTPITGWSQARRAREGIGRSYQRTTIFTTFTLLENCRLAAQAAVQKPWTLWQAASTCRASVERAWESLETAGLAESAHRIAGAISHGQQRQLEIAMCLATAPAVLLLDEPLAGMGAEETERMLAMLERLKANHAILLVEHDMDAVFRVADRITVMVNGRVIATDTPDNIRTSPEVRLAYLGESHDQKAHHA
ncbi:ABC transporter ATP-binding protein [Massilia sp. TWR1-2-2]|uniref:ABC transporter ATP-binding protein n=1 Tax=Massilia sp. TWR1-2-2 TaxID=2804584 RepID=UPI003CE73586